jgi:uncharacterized protein YjbI with pentapeptide repeats
MSSHSEPSESVGFEAQEARERIAKLNLEKRKLQLEIRSLSRQLSWRGLALEWLKSAGVLAALLGVGVTLYIGFGQIRQSEQNRSAERFDKALTRLASEKSSERITGVSALRLFLSERDTSLQAQALHFLVNAVSVETDPLVQAALLDVFNELKADNVGPQALDDSLRTAVERNKSLSTSIEEEAFERIARDQKQTMAQYAPLKLRADQIRTPIPERLIAQLPREEYLKFLEAERGPFERLEPKLDVPLHGLARLITTLMATGAKGNDLSGIYCERCDFTKSGDLSQVKFENAYLAFANFSRLRLRNSSFKDSNLSDAVFFAADLSNADLSQARFGFESTRGFPLFDCANLKGANLSGLPMLVYKEVFDTTHLGEHVTQVIAPRFLSALIDNSTKLDNFRIVVLTDVTDAYLLKHPRNGASVKLLGDREDTTENPLFDNEWVSPAYRRFKAPYTADEAAHSWTRMIQHFEIDMSNVSNIRSQAESVLRGYLDQPSLASLPLLSAFKNVVGSPTKHHWKDDQPYSCSDTSLPNSLKLKIDSGMHADGTDDSKDEEEENERQ